MNSPGFQPGVDNAPNPAFGAIFACKMQKSWQKHIKSGPNQIFQSSHPENPDSDKRKFKSLNPLILIQTNEITQALYVYILIK